MGEDNTSQRHHERSSNKCRPEDFGFRHCAALMLEKRISAVPMVEAEGRPLGVDGERNLVRHPETRTERPTIWSLELFTDNQDRACDYVRTRSQLALKVMSRPQISVAEDDDVAKVVRTLEDHHIKRVAVVKVGIASRANQLRAFVHAAPGIG